MSLRHILGVLAAILVVAAGFAAYLAAQDPGPMITIAGPKVIGGRTFEIDAAVDAPGGRAPAIDAWIEQGGARIPLPASGRLISPDAGDRLRVRQPIQTSSVPRLRDGSAQLIIEAVRPVLFGLRQARTSRRQPVAVHLSPPTIEAISTHHYVRPGGSEMVIYRVSPPDSESGVEVGDRFFRGSPASGVEGGHAMDPAVHVAFFALPFDEDVHVPIRLRARDAAGNVMVADFEHRVFPAAFSSSRLPLDDRLLSRIVPPILAGTPELKLPVSTPAERLDAFLRINRDVRRQNAERLLQLATGTSADWLAHGAFKRMAGSASKAPFAEQRTYMWNGRIVDRQVHLGFDLASTRGAAVAASNTGRVVFAGYLGIYGNCVVLDHGMGVQTLYAHLSAMDVEPGDRVEKGETLGRSGATGMAGGDHLHFTVLVGGVPVTPIEWWDPHWMHDRIERKLADAGISTASAPSSHR